MKVKTNKTRMINGKRYRKNRTHEVPEGIGLMLLKNGFEEVKK